MNGVRSTFEYAQAINAVVVVVAIVTTVFHTSICRRVTRRRQVAELSVNSMQTDSPSPLDEDTCNNEPRINRCLGRCTAQQLIVATSSPCFVPRGILQDCSVAQAEHAYVIIPLGLGSTCRSPFSLQEFCVALFMHFADSSKKYSPEHSRDPVGAFSALSDGSRPECESYSCAFIREAQRHSCELPVSGDYHR